ncbi:MAG: hypothetical protein ACO1PB_04270 [Ramlibacter sp.]
MPELHQNTAAGVSPATMEAAARWASEDYDFALGCECADPALQIERWGQDDGDAVAG